MKKSIFILVLGALLMCSCKIDNGTANKHTAKKMETYTRVMFRNNIIVPALTLKNLIELDRYIYASENKFSDEFSWHRKNIYHIDDVTFRVPDVGTVHTYGKSLFDNTSAWKINERVDILERLDEKSWKIDNTTITYEGRNEKGNNILTVEVECIDKYQTLYPVSNNVTAIVATQEGPMTLYMPANYTNKGTYIISEVPEGNGAFRIDTERQGKALDWMELRYSENGTKLTFRCNL
jgi:hypothetical protein